MESSLAELFSKEFVAAIERHGVTEFLYRKQYGWRID